MNRFVQMVMAGLLCSVLALSAAAQQGKGGQKPDGGGKEPRPIPREPKGDRGNNGGNNGGNHGGNNGNNGRGNNGGNDNNGGGKPRRGDRPDGF